MILRKARSAWRDARSYARFLGGLRSFLKRRMGLDEARAVIQERMAKREENFLAMMEGGVYAHPESPYRALLEVAGCAFADLEAAVRKQGLEATLESLRDAGVYVTFDEFWGKAPIERGGREIPVRPSSFENPFLTSYYSMSTGGSSGHARPVLPGSMPMAMSGLRLAANVTLLVTIAAEIVMSDTGLGSLVWLAWETLRVELLYATLIVVSLLGISISTGLHRLHRALTPWQSEGGAR